MEFASVIAKLTAQELTMLRFAKVVDDLNSGSGTSHCEAMAALTAAFAHSLSVSDEDKFGLFCGSYLHDIGKIAIPIHVLHKPGKLNPSEYAQYKTHTLIGYDICKHIAAFAPALSIIRSHHERWDGSGYPDGLGCEEIPLTARIFQIVDIYQALSTSRPYRRASTHEESLGAMTAGGLDPTLLRKFAAFPLSAHEDAVKLFPGLPPATDEVSREAVSSPRGAVDFYSCFISHSSKDAVIAKQLNDDLRARGIKCWYAPEDLETGAMLRPQFDNSIRLHDRLLLILSASSVASQWVESEVEAALEEERRRAQLPEELRGNPTVLFPIRIDDSIFAVASGWAAVVRRTRHIADFRAWQDRDGYASSLDKLLVDLKVSDEVDAKARTARTRAAAKLGAFAVVG